MGLLAYFREAYEELKRVNWPTREEVIQGTETTLVFIAGFTVLLWIADLVFRNVMTRVL